MYAASSRSNFSSGFHTAYYGVCWGLLQTQKEINYMNEALIYRPLDIMITGTRYPNNRGPLNPDRRIAQ